ncbi:MAG: glycosyltransferase family 2 protein [Ferruginibacter sp.]
MLLSVVSPVYMAEKIIEELVRRIQQSVSEITNDYEIILIEDGSKDRSWEKIEEQSALDHHVKGIKLSRNFGQHNAITAGLDNCKGEWIVVMDCDLQDRPEEIPRLYEEAKKGFDIVYAKRRQRHDSFFKKTFSVLFYKLFAWLSGVPQDGTIANFGIFSAKAIGAVSQLREPLRSFATMIKWVGFRSTGIYVEHAERYEGRSSYSFRKLIHLAMDISLAFSDKPLKMTVKLGAILAFGSMLFGAYTLYKYFTGQITEPGYTSLIVSLWFLSGLIIFILGVIGLYLSKVFEGIKGRPLYIIEKKYD